MKHITNITWALALCMGLTVSCKDDDEPGIPGGLALDKTEITMGPEGGIDRVQVTSGTDWVSSVSGPWVSVSPANGFGSAASVLSVDSTLENTARILEVSYVPKGQQSRTVTVTQFGYGKQILIKEPNVEIESSDVYDERVIDMTVQTNVAFKINDEDIEYSFAEEVAPEDEAEANLQKEGWLELERGQSNTPEVDLDRKYRPRTVHVKLRWNMNTVAYTRVAKLKLTALNPDDQLIDNDENPIDCVTLTVTQKAAPKITDDRAGDSLAILMICEKAQVMAYYEAGENMRNWDGVTLWERTDEVDGQRVPDEWVGRVRSVNFTGPNIQEGEEFPREIRYLKYLESLTIASNTNRQIRELELGEDICDLEHLKNLSITSYGLVELPENFVNLGDNLETLELNSNNFASLAELTQVINAANFPKLRKLDLSGGRRSDSFIDLTGTDGKYNGTPIGLWIDIDTDRDERQALIDLLTWDNLVYFGLSYGYIEGSLPTDEEMFAALGDKARYTEDDFFEGRGETEWLNKISKDTCQWLLSDNKPITNAIETEGVTGQDIPRVLPLARTFSINLNFLTGPMPNWIMFHPYFAYWNPGSMVFNQQEKGKNSDGVVVGFDNISPYDFNYSYYYGNAAPTNPTIGIDDENYATTNPNVAYPLYYYRFVAVSDESDE